MSQLDFSIVLFQFIMFRGYSMLAALGVQGWSALGHISWQS